jgi:hypothetical protein
VLGDEGYVQNLLLQSQAPPCGGFQYFTTNRGGCGVCNFHEIFDEISTLKFAFSESETAHPWFKQDEPPCKNMKKDMFRAPVTAIKTHRDQHIRCIPRGGIHLLPSQTANPCGNHHPPPLLSSTFHSPPPSPPPPLPTTPPHCQSSV